MDDRISIIVSTFNRKTQLKRLLESFTLLNCCCPFEFIIVDNCSDDGTRTIVENWKKTIDFADVKYHILPKRAPLAHSRNVGISLSTGNIIAFTDDDCRVDPAWLDQLYQRLISDPDYAGVGGRVLPVKEDIISQYNTVYRILEPPRHINTIIGANCMFWKQPVIDAGLFDEYFIDLGGEEIALCMKLWLKGYRFGFEEQGIVYHEYRAGLKNFIKTFYHYGTGDRVLFEHELNGYLRYMEYPEQMHNFLAFRNLFQFQAIFVLRMVFGIFRQFSSQVKTQIPPPKRVLLVGLYALHQFCYHLGRGTFYGKLVKQVEKYLINQPEGLCTWDRDTDGNKRILEITAVHKDGRKGKYTVTIKKQMP